MHRTDLGTNPVHRTDLVTNPVHRTELGTNPVQRTDLVTNPVHRTDLGTNPVHRTDLVTNPVHCTDLKRHETELKWTKLLQTSFPLGFNDNIYHEGNISKMPDFDVFSLLEIRKRKSRSHGIRKKGNGGRGRHAVERSNTSLEDLSRGIMVGALCFLF